MIKAHQTGEQDKDPKCLLDTLLDEAFGRVLDVPVATSGKYATEREVDLRVPVELTS